MAAEELEKLFANWSNEQKNEGYECIKYSIECKTIPCITKRNAYVEPELPQFYRSFCADGPVSDNYYNMTKRILFICKESALGDNPQPKNGEFWLKNQYDYRLNSNWKYSFSNAESVEDRSREKRIATKYCNLFRNIVEIITGIDYNCYAYMNLNKRGGFGSTDNDRLNAYCLKYKTNIMNEIKILDPDFIICGGSVTYDIVINLLKEIDNIKIIKFYHPSYTGATINNFLDVYKSYFDSHNMHK